MTVSGEAEVRSAYDVEGPEGLVTRAPGLANVGKGTWQRVRAAASLVIAVSLAGCSPNDGKSEKVGGALPKGNRAIPTQALSEQCSRLGGSLSVYLGERVVTKRPRDVAQQETSKRISMSSDAVPICSVTRRSASRSNCSTPGQASARYRSSLDSPPSVASTSGKSGWPQREDDASPCRATGT